MMKSRATSWEAGSVKWGAGSVRRIVLGTLGLTWGAALCPSRARADEPPAWDEPVVFRPDLQIDVGDGTADFSFIHDPENIPEAQRIFDRFAWRLFVGMNWPTNAEGLPDPNISLKQDAA